MIEQKLYNLFLKRNSWVSHLIYWVVAALLMFFLFSNRNYDLQIRLILVSLLIVVSYFISLVINKYLVPKFLFKGRFLIFVYSIFAVFIITLWVISFSIILILTYNAFYLPNLVIPHRSDIVILIAGNYIIVILAAVIHFIKESYRKILERDSLEEQKQVTELKLKEAKLKLLQGQIHPHFLFNMLNNLYGLVGENPKESRATILKLSELLDYMLYECDKPTVELEKELNFIHQYILLEKIRHDDDFNVVYNFPKETTLKISPLILFPFIENAFKHGFQDAKSNYINIDVSLSEKKVKLEVENNVMKANKDKYLKQEGKGIGLVNIKERLEFIYTGKYLLNINDDNNIFKVYLEIELEENE